MNIVLLFLYKILLHSFRAIESVFLNINNKFRLILMPQRIKTLSAIWIQFIYLFILDYLANTVESAAVLIDHFFYCQCQQGICFAKHCWNLSSVSTLQLFQKLEILKSKQVKMSVTVPSRVFWHARWKVQNIGSRQIVSALSLRLINASTEKTNHN